MKNRELITEQVFLDSLTAMVATGQCRVLHVENTTGGPGCCSRGRKFMCEGFPMISENYRFKNGIFSYVQINKAPNQAMINWFSSDSKLVRIVI